MYGTEPLEIGEAHVALSASGAGIAPTSDHAVTFAGSASCTIAPGASVTSDAVDMNVSAGSKLAVSLYLPGQVSNPTVHPIALETTYIVPGSHAGDAQLAAASTITSWPFLTSVEVTPARIGFAIVAFGDSITDGFASTLNADHRWTDYFSNQLDSKAGVEKAVLNAGLSGNRLLHDAPADSLWYGPSALNRFDRDVLEQPGVRFVIVLEGINDIGLPGYLAPISEQVGAAQITGALQELIQDAHRKGLKICGGTLTPFENAAYPGFYSPSKEAERQAVNQWIRSSNAFDAVIDFDLALRDPSQPGRLLPQYDSGDHFHPNDAGYSATAGAIDTACSE